MDSMGYVHVAWTNAYNSNLSPRHVYYNVWSPDSEQFLFENGTQISTGTRSGFVTLSVLPTGCSLPAFLESIGPSGYFVQVIVCDPEPGFQVPFDPGASFSPIIALDRDEKVQLLHLGYSEDMSELVLNYSRGIIEFDEDSIGRIEWQDVDGTGGSYVSIDTSEVFARAIAASRHTERLAIGLARSRVENANTFFEQCDNDAALHISNDGGMNWLPPANITNFVAGDTNCFDSTGDWRLCVQDTFRVFNDMSLLFDDVDFLHAAITTVFYYDFDSTGEEGFIYRNKSAIWHVSEGNGIYSPIVMAPDIHTHDGYYVDGGSWQMTVGAPSLAIDPVTGYLYCAYLRYDSTHISDNYLEMADVFISVSIDDGLNWSMGTNVSRTTPEQIPAPAPGSMHEREPTLAETVTDGILHLTYVLDHDGGSIPYQEGIATLNEFIYQRIPVDSIAPEPLVPNYPLHSDSTGFVGATERRAEVPREITLHPAYPNPFNSTITIRFELAKREEIALVVYDVLGRQVATLADGTMNPGMHARRWDAGGLASGIYFLRLETSRAFRIQKVMLLR